MTTLHNVYYIAPTCSQGLYKKYHITNFADH